MKAIQSGGLRLRVGGKELLTRPTCTDDPGELGAQDFVIVTLKAHSAPSVVDAMQPLLGPDTAVVTAMNGIPWWYFHGLEGKWTDHRLATVDPGGVQWDGIGPERAIGCVIYQACEVVEPGIIQHLTGDRFPLGEPDGSRSERCATLSEALKAAGLKAPIRPRIRDDIWLKLIGNLSFNPISALTHATLDVIANDTGTRALVRAMMEESMAVGEKLGAKFVVDIDQRIEGAAAVGAHKTSMLQDLERGRPMEIDALVGVVAEMGRLVGIETPLVDAVLALIRQRAVVAGTYP